MQREVGDDFPVIDGEPLAGARRRAGHDFIGDHEDAVFVAEFAHALHIAIGRNEDAVGADHGFEDEGGEGVRAFELDGFFDHGEGSLCGVPAALDAVVGVEDVDDAARIPRLGGQRRGSPVSVMLPPVAP